MQEVAQRDVHIGAEMRSPQTTIREIVERDCQRPDCMGVTGEQPSEGSDLIGL